MISCTEFIPAYSELFSWLDRNYGYEEVKRFWCYLFEPDGTGIPLINELNQQGIKGCFSYWSATLNEEAADFTLYLNEKAGWFQLQMHACPSKGCLLALEEKQNYHPYQNYCMHCDCYRYAVEKAGLQYIFNTMETDQASCSIFIYDPKIFDGHIALDADTKVMERKASENEYFHQDFHSSMNMGIEYIGSHYGLEAVKEYLTSYVKNACVSQIEEIRTGGLSAWKRIIEDTYRKEKALEVLDIKLTKDILFIELSRCPAIEYLKKTGRNVSYWYRYTTETVMEVIAKETGYSFFLDFYEESTGASAYRIHRQEDICQFISQ